MEQPVRWKPIASSSRSGDDNDENDDHILLIPHTICPCGWLTSTPARKKTDPDRVTDQTGKEFKLGNGTPHDTLRNNNAGGEDEEESKSDDDNDEEDDGAVEGASSTLSHDLPVGVWCEIPVRT